MKSVFITLLTILILYPQSVNAQRRDTVCSRNSGRKSLAVVCPYTIYNPAPVQPLTPVVPYSIGAIENHKFLEWGMGFSYTLGFNDDNFVQGFSLFVQRMVNRYVGVEAGLEGFYRIGFSDESPFDLTGAASLSLLVFPWKAKNSGINWYFRAGIFSPLGHFGMDDMEDDTENNKPDKGFADSALWYGAGFQWRAIHGSFSMNLELVRSNDMIFSNSYPIESAIYMLRWYVAFHW